MGWRGKLPLMRARWQPTIYTSGRNGWAFYDAAASRLFSISGDGLSVSSASNWSRIFNIRVLMPATRFEIGETGSTFVSRETQWALSVYFSG
jgi:hypothetical protein